MKTKLVLCMQLSEALNVFCNFGHKIREGVEITRRRKKSEISITLRTLIPEALKIIC